MDDFLHNLRSGKLKQPDRSNRSYGDPQYKNKRNLMDRRNKRDLETKESFERLTAIKEVLESVAETQKRMAKAYELRTKAEERKATALEVLAKSVYRMANPGAADVDNMFSRSELIPPMEAPVEAPVENPVENNDPTTEKLDAPQDTLQTDSSDEEEAEPKNNADNRQELFELIHNLREKGTSWEKIAREIAAKGYPTVSGRGSWRGVMVKNLYEKMAAEA